jgi:V/A-type H+-transporting ATPase subunit I
MIVPMCRVRLIGPRERLSDALAVVQDFGKVQLERLPPSPGLLPERRDAAALRRQRYLRRLLDDSDAAIRLLDITETDVALVEPTRTELATWARSARRTRRRADQIRMQRDALADEQAVLLKYKDFLEAFRDLLAELAGAKHLRVYGVTVAGSDRHRVDSFAETLRKQLEVEVIVATRALPSGDLAVLIAVPVASVAHMEAAFGAAKIADVPLPTGYAGETLTEAAPRMLARLDEIPRQLGALNAERDGLARSVGPMLVQMRASADDQLRAAAASTLTSSTAHAFAVDGWLPESEIAEFRAFIEKRLGESVVLEELAREAWQSADAPVVLSNPRIFRPFEVLTALMPLPRYGSIDPTPFVAVGFPMLFGMILGDVGYGVALGLLAALIRWRSTPESMLRKVAAVGIACSMFAIIFGFVFGELFGPMGRHWFGLEPLLFDREQAIIAAILVAIGIGLVHTMLGLVLGIVSTVRGEPRLAASRAVQLGMMILVVLALLSAVHVLPSALFTKLAVAVVVGFPILVLLEGFVAPIEFLSTLASVLSYVRIMALGTASVLLAVAAGEMVGVFGSAIVGVLFGLLFHLVNLAMGVFSPTVHALRLHYVEFFRQFYSPGGRRYEPFRHRPSGAASSRGSS